LRVWSNEAASGELDDEQFKGLYVWTIGRRAGLSSLKMPEKLKAGAVVTAEPWLQRAMRGHGDKVPGLVCTGALTFRFCPMALRWRWRQPSVFSVIVTDPLCLPHKFLTIRTLL